MTKLLIILLFILLPANLLSITVQKEHLYRQGDNAVLQLNIQDTIITNDLLKNLHYGIPVEINFKFKLIKAGLFFDEVVLERNIRKLLRFDRWSDTYFLQDENNVITRKDVGSLEKVLFKLKPIHLGAAKPLKDDHFYQLEFKVMNKEVYFYYNVIKQVASIFANNSTVYKSSILQLK